MYLKLSGDKYAPKAGLLRTPIFLFLKNSGTNSFKRKDNYKAIIPNTVPRQKSRPKPKKRE